MNTETLVNLFKHTTMPTEDETSDVARLQVLYCFVRMIKPRVCVEIGSRKGYSAAWTAQALKDNDGPGHLTCIDPFVASGEGMERDFRETLFKLRLERHVTLVNDYSKNCLKFVPKPINFLFIDGDHSKEGVALDIENYVPLLSSEGVVVFHDYRVFPGVKEAIRESKELEGFLQFPLPTNNYWMYLAIKP